MYAKCALASAAKLPCPANWDFVRPQRCKGDSRFDEGIKQGTADFYAALKKVTTASTAESSVSPTKAKQPPPRRFSTAECRLIKLEIPVAARLLGEGGTSIDEITSNVERNTGLTQAAEAMKYYLAMFQSHDLRAFPYEIAEEWSKKCNAGQIREFRPRNY